MFDSPYYIIKKWKFWIPIPVQLGLFLPIAYSDGYKVTNTHTPEETTVTVTKEWSDNNNQDGIRPTSVQVQLNKAGKPEGRPVTLDQSSNWTYTWEELDKYADGEVIEYTVEEVKTRVITGTDGAGTYAYEVTETENGYKITNTHTPEDTTVTVTKEWSDGENQDGIRPTSVQIISSSLIYTYAFKFMTAKVQNNSETCSILDEKVNN